VASSAAKSFGYGIRIADWRDNTVLCLGGDSQPLHITTFSSQRHSTWTIPSGSTLCSSCTKLKKASPLIVGQATSGHTFQPSLQQQPSESTEITIFVLFERSSGVLCICKGIETLVMVWRITRRLCKHTIKLMFREKSLF